MTDRHSAYIVVLREDVREDDPRILTALRMIHGVASVEPVMSDYSDVIARARRDQVWTDALIKMVDEVTGRRSAG